MGAVEADAELGIDRLDPESREAIQRDTRTLLRHGGYKPSGRGKPSSEYLVRANRSGDLPNINVAVDACNALSLHSGLPISVVDLELLKPPFTVATVDHGSYQVQGVGSEVGAGRWGSGEHRARGTPLFGLGKRQKVTPVRAKKGQHANK